MKKSDLGDSNGVFRLRNDAQFPERRRRRKKKIDVKYLVLIMITCLLLSLLISFLLDGTPLFTEGTLKNMQKEIISQEIEKLKKEGITIRDPEKIP